jgi:hypothetical protein
MLQALIVVAMGVVVGCRAEIGSGRPSTADLATADMWAADADARRNGRRRKMGS